MFQQISNLLPYLYLTGWILMWVIRVPHIRKSISLPGTPYEGEAYDQFLVLVLFLGNSFVPLISILTPWLDRFRYQLPLSISLGCVILLISALIIVWKAHQELGESYSQDLEIKQDHQLIVTGIYRIIRHPIYAGGFLMAISQVGLLLNWLAGLSGILTLTVFYLLRFKKEEQMLLDQFGSDYLTYQKQTPRLIPRLPFRR